MYCIQTMCVTGGMLNCPVDHILQEFYTEFFYWPDSKPTKLLHHPKQMTSKDDTKGLVSLSSFVHGRAPLRIHIIRTERRAQDRPPSSIFEQYEPRTEPQVNPRLLRSNSLKIEPLGRSPPHPLRAGQL
jgi:hypothetical protein